MRTYPENMALNRALNRDLNRASNGKGVLEGVLVSTNILRSVANMQFELTGDQRWELKK